MSDPKVLTCPTCGAQLNVNGEEPQVKCGYCGNTVIVPEALRVKHPEVLRVEMPQPQVVVVQGPAPLPGTPVEFYSPPRSSSAFAFLGCLFPIVLTGAIFAFVYVMLPSSAKQFFTGMIQSATSQGFARQVSSFGGEGTGAGLFQDARHVAADGSGNVYVSDYNSLRIQRFDAGGRFLNLWTIDEKGKRTSKNGPDRLVADRNGNVYVQWTGLVFKYDGASGKLLGKISGQVSNTFLNQTEDIRDIALLPNGNLLAITSSAADENLVRFDPNGAVLNRVNKIVSAQSDESVFPSSLHLAVDGLGNIFILNSFANKAAVYVFNQDGKYVNKFGSKGDQAGQFDAFNDLIGVDGKSRVYVKDWDRLLVFDSSGRYIDTISDNLYDRSLFDFAFSNDDLFVVSSRNKIFKLSVSTQ